jgi:putative cell wall-binding protein
LVELVVEDVLIVCKGDDELNDQLATTSYHGATCAPVGVFPVDAVILLVKTDNVLCILGGTIGVDENTVEVLQSLAIS